MIDEWLRVAEHEDSTRDTYVGYIERTIKSRAIRWLEAIFTARGVWLAYRYAPRGEVTES